MTYNEMIKKAWDADRSYYVKDKPIMTDEAYDALIRQIEEYEMRHPDRVNEFSPTQRIGGKAIGAFKKVKHPTKMLSLNNAFTLAELQLFASKANKVSGDGATFVVEPKLDGLTLVCSYSGGKLVQALTRGNGVEGEDVTITAKTIRNLPLTVEYERDFQVRGECVMPKEVFRDLNEKLVASGEEPFANPRNAAAGSLRQKDPALTAERRLSICFYDLYNGPKDRIYTEIDKLIWMEEIGLPTVKSASEAFEDMDSAFQFCKECGTARSEFPVEIDGMVLKVNRVFVQEKLGSNNKFPNWAIAYKFPAEHKETTLKSVEWQVGRTGKVTPVAVVTPVDMNGITLTHASLHNPAYIAALKLCVGDSVTVYKAAEVIPQVGVVLKHNNGAKVENIDKCPCCGTALVLEGADLTCGNTSCAGRVKANLYYFGARPNMYIKGLGKAVIDQLVDNGMVVTAADLYTLTKDQLLKLDGFSDKKAESLLQAIEESKSRPFHHVLASLGIDLLGESTAVDIAVHMPSMEKVMQATVADFTEIPGIAQKTAMAIYAGLHDSTMERIIEQLKAHGLTMMTVAPTAPQTLAGLTICITGSLSKDRDTYKAEIQEHGGKFSTSVSSKTSYLVAGDGGGEKRNKATKLGVPIITEDQLQEMINGK